MRQDYITSDLHLYIEINLEYSDLHENNLQKYRKIFSVDIILNHGNNCIVCKSTYVISS